MVDLFWTTLSSVDQFDLSSVKYSFSTRLIFPYKVNNRNTKKGVKYVQRRQRRRSGIFIVNFEDMAYIFLVFLLLTLNK